MGESRIVDHDVRPGFRRSCACGCKRPSEALFFFLIQQAAGKRQLSSRTRHQKGANDGQQKHATEALKMFQEPSLLGLKIPITKKAARRYAHPIIQRNTETDGLQTLPTCPVTTARAERARSDHWLNTNTRYPETQPPEGVWSLAQKKNDGERKVRSPPALQSNQRRLNWVPKVVGSPVEAHGSEKGDSIGGGGKRRFGWLGRQAVNNGEIPTPSPGSTNCPIGATLQKQQ